MSQNNNHLKNLSETEKIERIRALEAQITSLEQQLKETQRDASKSDTILTTLLDNITDHITVRDAEGRYLLANPAQASSLNTTVNAMLGTTMHDWFEPEVAQIFAAEDQQIMETSGVIAKQEMTDFGQGDDNHWFDVKKVPIRQDDQTIAIMTIAREVTKEQQALNDLNEKHLLLQTVINAIPEQISIVGDDEQYVFVNQTYADYVGAESPESVVGTSHADWYEAENAKRFKQEDDRIRRERQHLIDIETVDTLGSNQWLELSKVPVIDGDENVVGIVTVTRDITERKHAQQEQSAHKQLLETLVNSIPSQISVYDTEGRYTVVNQAFADHIKAPSIESVIGTTGEDWFPQEDAVAFRASDAETYQSGQPYLRTEVKGSFEGRWFDISKAPIIDEAGNRVAMVAIAHDVTERKQAEEENIAQKNLLETLINAIPDHVYVFDEQDRYVLVNQAFAEHHGEDSEEAIIGQPVKQWYPPETTAAIIRENQEIRQTHEPLLNFEVSDVFSDQGWYELSKVPVIDTDGNVGKILCVSREITERKKIQQEQAAQTKLLQTLINAIPDQIFIYNEDGKYSLANQAFADHIGAEKIEDVIGTIETDWYPIDHTLHDRSQDEEIYQTGEPRLNIELKDPLGGRWFDVSKIPLIDEETQTLSIVGIARDITERKEHEQEQARQKQLLETLINALPDSIAITDNDHRYMYVNQAYADSVNADNIEAVIGTKHAAWYSASDAELFNKEDDEIRQTGQPILFHEEVDVVKQDHWVELSKVPVFDENGEVSAVTGIYRDITERKRAEQEQIAQKKLLETLINAIPDHIFVLDDDNRFMLTNRAYANHLGAKDTDSMVGTTAEDWFPPDFIPLSHEENETVRQTRVPVLNLEIADAINDERWFELSKLPVIDDEDNLLAIVGVARDVTERKRVAQQLENRNQQLQTIIDTVPDHIYVKDEDFNFTFVNKPYAAQFGVKPEDVVGTDDRQWFPEDDATSYREDDAVIRETGQPNLDFDVLSPINNGWVRISKVPMYDSSGEFQGIIGISRDITERHKAEQELVHREQLLQSLIDAVPDHIFVTDRNQNYIMVNKAYSDYRGAVSPQDVVHTDKLTRYPANHHQRILDEDRLISETGEPLLNKEIRSSRDPSRWFSITKVPIKNEAGEVVRIAGIARDISGMKRVEQEIAEQRDFLQTLIDTIPDQIFVTDVNNDIMLVNEAHAAHVGAEAPHTMQGTNRSKWLSDVSAALYVEETRQIVETGEPILNFQMQSSKDPSKWYSVTKVPLQDKSGEITGVIGISRDITNRKQAEQEIREQHQLLRTLIDAIPDHVFVMDIDGNYLQCNQSIAKELGVALSDDLVGTNLRDWFDDELSNKFLAENAKIKATGQPILSLVEPDNRRQDQTIWYDVSKLPIHDANGDIVSIVGIARNISQIKQAEQEIREQHELLRTLVDSLPLDVFIRDKEGEFLLSNESNTKRAGAPSPEAMVGTNINDWFPQQQANEYLERDRAVFESGQALLDYEEHRVIGSDESWYNISKIPLLDEAGSVTSLLGVCQNITPTKRAEQELQERNQLLQTLIDALPDLIFVLDNDHHFLLVNQAEAAAAGADSPSNMIGTKGEDWFDDKAVEIFYDTDRKVIETGDPLLNIEEQIMVEDRGHWYSTSKIPIRDSDGQVTQIVGIARDVTPIKQAEQQLQERNRLLQTLIDAIPDNIFVRDSQGRYLLVNQANVETLGAASAEEVVGTSYDDWFPQDLSEQFTKRDQQVIETKSPIINFAEHRQRAEHDAWYEVSKIPVEDDKGDVVQLVGISRDVTLIKRAEQKLIERNQLLQTLIDALPDIIFVIDAEQRYLMVNQAQAERVGAKSPDEMIGTLGTNWFDEETAQQFSSSDKIVITSGETMHDTQEEVYWNNSLHYYNTTKVPILDEHGNLTQIVGIARDITELKTAQQELSEQYTLLRTLIDAIPDLIWVTDRDLKYMLVNEAEVKAAGAESAEAMIGTIGGDWFESTLSMENHYERDRQVIIKGEPTHAVEESLIINDELVWHQTSKVPLRDKSGEIIGLVGVARDVTELKKAQEELTEQYTLLRTLIDAIPDAIFVVDTDLKYLMVNEAEAAVAGASSPQDMVGTYGVDWFKPDSVEDFTRTDRQILESGIAQTDIEVKQTYSADGQDHWLIISKIPLRDVNDKVIGLVGVARDITELKTAQEELTEQNTLMRTLIDAIPDLIFVVDTNHKYLLVNEAEAKAANAPSAQAMVGTLATDWFRDDNVGDFFKYDEVVFTTGKAQIGVEEKISYDDRDNWYLVSKIPLRDQHERIVGLVAVARDISERKEMEETLRRSEALLQSILASQTTFVIRTDMDGNYTYVNEAMYKRFEWMYPNLDDMLGDSSMSSIIPEDHSLVYETVMNCISKPGESFQISIRKPTADDSFFWGLWEFVGITDMSGNVSEIQCVGIDISARKEMEEALRRSERLFKSLAENSPDVIARFDLNGYFIYANPAVERILQLSPDALSANYQIPEQLRPQWFTYRDQALETKQTVPGILIYSIDGEENYYESFLVPELDEDGNIETILTVAHDITEIRRNQEALQRSEARIRSIIDNTDIAHVLVDVDGRIQAWNQTAEQFSRQLADRQILEGNILRDFALPEDLASFDEDFKRAVDGETVRNVKLSVKDRILSLSYTPVRVDSAEIIGVSVMVQDITEQHRSEQVIRESEANLSALVNNTEDYIWSVDKDLRVIMFNQNYARYVRETWDESIEAGVDILSLLKDPDVRQQWQGYYERALAGERFQDEFPRDFPKGKLSMFNFSIAPIVDKNGDITGATVYVRDITERYQMEQAIRENEANLSSLVNNTQDYIWSVDKDLRVIMFNQNYARYVKDKWGKTIEQGMDIMSFINSSDVYAQWQGYYERALAGERFQDELQRELPNGITYVFNTSIAPILDDNDEITGVTVYGRDITERYQMEQAIRENEAKLSALINNTDDMIWSVDKNYKIISFNKNFIEDNRTVWNVALVAGMNSLELTGRKDVQDDWQGYYNRALAGESFREEFSRILPDGRVRTQNVALAPILEEDGIISGVTVIARDITERYQMEQALHESRKAYRMLIDNFPNGMVALYDHDLVYTVAGGTGLSILDMTEADFVGKRLRDFMPPEIVERDEPQLRQALQGQTIREEIAYGELVFEVQTIPITDEAGKVTSGMLMSQNITERKIAEREALNAALERERIQILEEFIQDVSHEFRTSLSRVHLAIHALQRLHSDEKSTRYIMRIQEQSEQTLGLIEDLLTAVRVGGDFNVSFYRIQMSHALQQVVEGCRYDAEEKQITIETSSQSDLPSLVGNETYLMLAFTKILDNAIRYSMENGHIQIKAKHTDEHITVEITDDGIGMVEETIERIFDRFFRLDTAHSTSGFGLGLPIARRIIEAHDGKIEVDSEKEVGSTFRIILPLNKETPSDLPKLYR